jgi:hypothetical protein
MPTSRIVIPLRASTWGVVLSLLIVVSPAVAQPVAKPAEQSAAQPNAALFYWQAFDALHDIKPDSEEGKLLTQWDTVALDGKVAALVDESDALDMFELATSLDHCDWGMSFLLTKLGPEALHSPHPRYAQRLSRLALLRARYRLKEGRTAAVVQDALRVMKLGRHIGVDADANSVLMDIEVEQSARLFMADHLAGMTDDDLAVLTQGMAKLPGRPTPGDCTRQDRAVFVGYLERRFKAVGANEFAAEVRKFGGDPKALKPDVMVKLIQHQSETYDELARLADLPYAEGWRKAVAFEKKIYASNDPLDAISKLTLPNVSGLINKVARDQVQRQMLLAAVALKTGGDAAFTQVKDPFGDGSFGRREVDGVVELSSTLNNWQDKPATMRFHVK